VSVYKCMRSNDIILALNLEHVWLKALLVFIHEVNHLLY
jgi:hypothetical protein